MIKRSFVLVWVIALLAASSAIAADEPATTLIGTEPVLIAQQAETSTESIEAASDTEADVPPDEPIVQRKPPHVFGLAVGSYTSLDSEVKDTFGGTKIRVGLRPLLTEAPKRTRLMYDVSFYVLRDSGNQALLIPLTVGMMRGFGQETKLQSYVALNAGMFYGDVDAPSVGVSKNGWGFTANTTIGLIYNKRFMVEARYEIMDEFAGFDFDSFSLMAAYKILQMRF